jgi:hypothetical protein
MTRHRLAYAGLYLFTLILYVRPNDWLPIGDFPVAKLVAAATIAVFLKERLSYGEGLSVVPRELKLLLGIVACMFLSVPLAIDPGEALGTIVDLFLKVVLVFVLIINVVNSYERLQKLMALTVFCGTVLAAGTLRNFVAGEDLRVGYRAQGIVGGMFQNPNDLALALDMLIPLALGLALTAKSSARRLVCLGCAVVMLGAVLATYSRGGFISLVAIGAYMSMTAGRRFPKLRALAILAALVLLLLSPAGYGDRLLSIFSPELDASGSSSERSNILKRSVEVFVANPKIWLVGVGASNFRIVSIGEAVNHNAYFQVLTEVGVPAFIFYLLFLSWSFRGLRPVVAGGRVGDPEAVRLSIMAHAIQASLIGYMTGSVFASVAYQWFVYYAAGYSLCLRGIARVAAKRQVTTAPSAVSGTALGGGRR